MYDKWNILFQMLSLKRFKNYICSCDSVNSQLACDMTCTLKLKCCSSQSMNQNILNVTTK